MDSDTHNNFSPSGAPPTDGEEDNDSLTAIHAGAKRRIASLEDQLASLQEAVTKRKSYVTQFICFPSWYSQCSSDVVSNVTQGRAICRLVSMFETVDDLVEENDRWLSFEEDDDGANLQPFTLQWVI